MPPPRQGRTIGSQRWRVPFPNGQPLRANSSARQLTEVDYEILEPYLGQYHVHPLDIPLPIPHNKEVITNLIVLHVVRCCMQ
jgi:hypothetical protein